MQGLSSPVLQTGSPNSPPSSRFSPFAPPPPCVAPGVGACVPGAGRSGPRPPGRGLGLRRAAPGPLARWRRPRPRCARGRPAGAGLGWACVGSLPGGRAGAVAVRPPRVPGLRAFFAVLSLSPRHTGRARDKGERATDTTQPLPPGHSVQPASSHPPTPWAQSLRTSHRVPTTRVVTLEPHPTSSSTPAPTQPARSSGSHASGRTDRTAGHRPVGSREQREWVPQLAGDPTSESRAHVKCAGRRLKATRPRAGAIG